MAESEPKPETPLFKKIVPARGAAQKAAANLKQQHIKRSHASTAQVENGSDQESDAANAAEDEDEEMEMDHSLKRKRSGARGSRGQRRGRGRPRGGNHRARTPVRHQPSMKSLKSCATPSPRGSSPLSSPEFKTPQKRLRPSTSGTPSKRAKVANPARDVSSSLAARSVTPPLRFKPKDDYGDSYTEGDLVWVRLNLEGYTVDPQKVLESELYWWPAQVTSDKLSQVDVRLFGDDGHGADRLVNISTPSSSTILSFRQEGCTRFSPANFTLANTPPNADPFEAQTSTEAETSNLTSRWEAAFDLALAGDGDEEFPDPHTLLNMSRSANEKGKGTRGRVSYGSEPIFTPSPTRIQKAPPAPLDEEIKVGTEDGELVLARDHKDRPDHWPARVVGVSQNRRTGSWLYEVCFMDGKKRKVDRKWFFSSDEEGFATCQMGVWRTELAPSDTEGTDTEDDLRKPDTSRYLSPAPSETDLEDIIDCKAFGKLPLTAQMRYVYPFLCRIIRREYPPSFDRHDAFIRGGKARGHLGQTASLRGEFSDNEVKKVSALVRRTMLRDERWAERVYDGDDVRNEVESSTALASDETKAESVTGSVVAQSPDLDAAMALAGLKSSEEYTLSSTLPTLALEPAAPVLPAESVTTEINAESPKPPPSSMVSSSVIDQSSDMEIGSGEEDNLHETPGHSSLVNKDEESSQQSNHVYSLPPAGYLDSPQKRSVPQDNEDPPSAHVPAPGRSRTRPTGCVEYENLPRSDRGLYCADVLLPEAVLQLHLLRAGCRTSAHLLTPEEETKLYEEGQELLQTEVHWLTQIVQLRKIAERTLKRSEKKKDTYSTIPQGGTSSRPKMLKSKD